MERIKGVVCVLPAAKQRMRRRGCRRPTAHRAVGLIVRLPSSVYLHEKEEAAGFLFFVERIKGVEPSCSAWEADVLPMNYIRRFSFADSL